MTRPSSGPQDGQTGHAWNYRRACGHRRPVSLLSLVAIGTPPARGLSLWSKPRQDSLQALEQASEASTSACPGTDDLLLSCSVIVSVSTPIIKSVTFLTADLSVAVASVSIDGTVNLGTFGWCLNGVGTKPVCQGPQLGYELDSDQVFGNSTSFSLPNSLIKWLTYALIVHPIAAGLAAASFLSGCISHCREFSTSRVTTWLTSFATTIALIAFVFDIVLFSIAKSRINGASNNDVGLKASLGNAVWLTLVGFILLFISGCLFGFGHRCIKRRPTQEEKDRVRPQMDTVYASAARKDADDLEKAEANRRVGTSGLPAFPEEEVPLTSVPKTEELYTEESNSSSSQDIAGVGTGYGRGPNPNDYYSPLDARNPLPAPPPAAGNDYGAANPSYGHAEPFTSMYDAPSRQNSPAYGRPSRSRQGSDPATTAAYASPYVARRQGGASTSGYGRNGYFDPARAATLPNASQYGGRDPAGLVASAADPSYNAGYSSSQVQDRSAYEQQSAGQMQQYPDYNQAQVPPDNNRYGQGYEQYPPTAPYSQTTLPPASDSQGFHALAASSRHRQSRSMGAAVASQPGNRGHQQSLSDQAWPHQQRQIVDSNAYLQPQAGPRRTTTTGSRADRSNHPSEPYPLAPQNALSPTTEIYDSYYNSSPLNAIPPAAIPYVADPESTPSPSYHSAEPYPTYGGNVYR